MPAPRHPPLRTAAAFPINGHVERNNGTWRYEFYATWKLPDDLDRLNDWINAFSDEFNRFRPHQSLGGQTPVEYLAGQADEQTPASHM